MDGIIKATDGTIKGIVRSEIDRLGLNANLNHIDVSSVTSLEGLFYNSRFNGDISKWNVSNVTDMNHLFYNSEFNGDISEWDVSNVTNMNFMFAESNFNKDISKWDVSNVKTMVYMFESASFNQDISKWDVSNVKDMGSMFLRAKFNQDISEWNIAYECWLELMFEYSSMSLDNLAKFMIKNINIIADYEFRISNDDEKIKEYIIKNYDEKYRILFYDLYV
jgi:surface protein